MSKPIDILRGHVRTLEHNHEILLLDAKHAETETRRKYKQFLADKLQPAIDEMHKAIRILYEALP